MRYIQLAVFAVLLISPLSSAAAEELCEPTATDCRARLLTYINRETARLDIGMEEMTDVVLADAIIARFKAGVPVRLIVEPRRNTQVPENGPILEKFRAAGIPMRKKASGSMLHWKMMIFTGQHVVEFGATNFTKFYLVPVQAYTNFTQDPLYFTSDTPLVRSFQRKFEDAWVDTTSFVNHANITSTPARMHPTYAVDPAMNFVPAQNFATRAKPLYDAETQRIDVLMYKITESTHADALIRARSRGVPVRLITEPDRYRNPANVWQAYHIDRLYAAGVQIRDRAHAGFMHQKTTLLYSQGRTIFGSSNWTTESNQSQYEHNYFSISATFFESFRKMFVRKWTTAETKAFVPKPPDAPLISAPAHGAAGQPTTVTLAWRPGRWAHRADVYLGTSPTPPLFKAAVAVSPNSTGRLAVSGLAPRTTYYWRIVSKTMAGKSASGPVWTFATQ